jgi:hypothetical protein
MLSLEERLKWIEAPAIVSGTNVAPRATGQTPAVTAVPPQSGTSVAAARLAAIERGKELAGREFEQDAEKLDRNLAPATNAYVKQRVELGNQFFSRPVLRAFVTYAQWSNDFVGQAGGQDYLSDHNGFTYGLQMEAWW